MKIKLAKTSDTNQIKEIWGCCFKDSDPFLSWNFERNYSPQNTLVFEDNGKILSNLQMIPYTININNQPVKASYISGAATLPEHRNKGLIRSLLHKSFEVSMQRGQDISLLVPFNYEFYERFGYKLCYNLTDYKFKSEDFSGTEYDGQAENGELNEKTIEILANIYSHFTKNLNGYVLRTLENWRLILEDLILNCNGNVLLLKNSIGEFTGYALYRIEDETVNIFEMGYKNYAAQIACISAISRLNIPQIKLTAPADDPLFIKFADTVRNSINTRLFAMARILNAENVFTLLAKDFQGNTTIMVTDNLIGINNRTFCIQNENVTVCDMEGDIKTDISTLTMLVFGFISIEKAYEMELVSGDISKCGTLFKKSTNYINMVFS